MGFLFIIPPTHSLLSLSWKRNDISVAAAQPSGASWPCALGYVGESARENLERRDAPESAYHDRDLFSEDWTWNTVGSPSGRKPHVSQLYLKTPQRSTNLGQFSGAAICHLLEKKRKKRKKSDGRAMDAMSWILMQKVLDSDEILDCWSLIFDFGLTSRLRRRFEGETPASGITGGRICGAW